MNERKPIPIGVEDFKRLIDDGYYFIDKTLMIKELLDQKGMVNLYTRPRRFGKTLNMSMLKRYFEKTEEDNSYLFEGLKISEAGEKYCQHMGKYPVISISLKGMKQPTWEQAFIQFKEIIANEFERHQEILKCASISERKRKRIQSILDDTADDTIYSTALKLLSDCLFEAYNQKVIVLIDEYDVPLENAYFNGFYDNTIDLMCSVFESVLKTNDSLEFGVLTGCLRISKESIFTGLNNLKVNSIRFEKFSNYFGFTESEIKKLSEYYVIGDKFEEIKKWYDGYRFGTTDIYNPWSVLNYIQTAITMPDAPPEPYWSNTSSNSIIHKLITESDITVRNMIEELMNGESISVPIYEDTVYADIDVNNDSIWSFLLFTGYLKIINTKNIDNMLYADLVIPNIEVRTIYQRTIIQWFKEKVNANPRRDLFEALINEDIESIEDILCDWLDETISYHDEKEQFYHGFLTGLLSGFKGYTLKSNRESGDGRLDLMLMERRRRELAIVIEVKDTKNFNELEKLCNEGLAQIDRLRYEAELKHDRYKKIIKYGIAFCQKSCMVKH
ncbi:MAG: ATP-binding protein [Ruminococcus flavefaciens]|nr:ATP-binding protein [Ruminococcus flavefaciens]MCM1060912.1 ATP-binding protein [Eubacterium sp.]